MRFVHFFGFRSLEQCSLTRASCACTPRVFYRNRTCPGLVRAASLKPVGGIHTDSRLIYLRRSRILFLVGRPIGALFFSPLSASRTRECRVMSHDRTRRRTWEGERGETEVTMVILWQPSLKREEWFSQGGSFLFASLPRFVWLLRSTVSRIEWFIFRDRRCLQRRSIAKQYRRKNWFRFSHARSVIEEHNCTTNDEKLSIF